MISDLNTTPKIVAKNKSTFEAVLFLDVHKSVSLVQPNEPDDFFEIENCPTILIRTVLF